ncbi:MAG: hypothetical protein UW22_C0038G0002 [Candidatus Gottesmanbacteria bacterium GW2011_GWB1_44_11c]|uniref:Transposase IS200-like domain-containing protein n=2 Tax=Candidatus Gottesmaniibacteriota TaxID=1752720 RepID=A0A0G1KUR3_9BACT|nr:MAG: hypothetical protein UW22_C0038G0002 [Candidatus Gottesmanbacteria bacterium GW2011_GWB1_44_11c]KKT60077.1 MAG: hypothetical protein UW52_C0029G0002 [Candidatus Gottesmanbacteria bacterium GW2011_GWA1_44_24b]
MTKTHMTSFTRPVLVKLGFYHYTGNMPSRYQIKPYCADSFYHLYNRGVEKHSIFNDDQDYGVFLSYVKTYLEPKDEKGLSTILLDPLSSSKEKYRAQKLLRLNNFFGEISLPSYCLLPNHFHFLVFQKSADAIDRFMNSLFTRFTMYMNKKNKRVGPLFQSVYKAVLVDSDEQLLYTSRYIHRNPIGIHRSGRRYIRMLATYPYSSYPDYLGIRKTPWVESETILSFFSTKTKNSYQSFVEDPEETEREIQLIGKKLPEPLEEF